MKGLSILLLLVLIGGCTKDETGSFALETREDSISYSIGMDIGKNLANQSIKVDADALARGIADKTGDGTTMLTDEEMNAMMQLLQEQMQKDREILAVKSKADGEKFLQENATKEGVVALPSGLQYKVIKEGTGASPAAADNVVTHYRGRLLNGKEFDSSFERGEPATFPVNGVIPGWTEALQLMKVGGKWELYVPSDLAYGPMGAGANIGPNETLIFELELLEITKQ